MEMIHLIWALMAIIGIVYAMFHGTMEEVNEVILTSAAESVALTIQLLSILVFWLGMMKIAQEVGLLQKITKLLTPVLKRLFPELRHNNVALGYIVSNVIANMFGLGNAATPLGIKAMQEMKKDSKDGEATRSMITFLAINTSSFTLIPTTVIAIRMQYGSVTPTDIVITTIISSFVSVICAILFDRYFYHREIKRNGGWKE